MPSWTGPIQTSYSPGGSGIASLREGSEDGGEADGGARSEGIGQGSSPFSDVRG